MWRILLLLVLAVACADIPSKSYYNNYEELKCTPEEEKQSRDGTIRSDIDFYNKHLDILQHSIFPDTRAKSYRIVNEKLDSIYSQRGKMLERVVPDEGWIKWQKTKLERTREKYKNSSPFQYTTDGLISDLEKLSMLLYYYLLYRNFGCVFDKKDNYLVYSHHSCGTNKLASMFNVKYGKEVNAMDFSGIGQLKTTIDTIQSIYTNVTKRLMVGNIPEFIEFYKSRKRSDEDFETFFKHYHLNYTKIVDENTAKHCPAYILILKNFKQIFHNIKKVEKHCYLVAVYENSPSELLKEQEFRLSHMAGAIRIKLNRRPGVILMDTGDNAFGPVVLMKDLKYPHMYSKLPTNQSSQDTNNEEKTTCAFSWVVNSIVETLYSPEPVSNTTINYAGKTYSFNFTTNNVVKLNIDGQPNPNVYNIAQSYCSFVTSTFKRQLLLKTSKTLFRRDSEGYLTASVSFDITENNPQFKMTMYEKGRSKNEMIIGFDEFHRMNETQTNHLNAVLRKLELESSDSQVTLRNILEDAVKIAKDKEFMNEYKENHLYMVQVREGQIENTKKF